MIRLLAFILAVLIASTAMAQAYVGFNAEDGVHAVQVVVQGGKVVSVTPIPVFDLDGPTPPIPPVPPVPPTPDLTPNAKAIFDAVLTVQGDATRSQTAADLAAILSAFADKAPDGNTLKLGVPMMVSMFISQSGKSASWAPVVQAISTRMAACDATGDRCKVLLGEIVDGLNAASPDAKAQIDIATIMMIIEMIMKLLELFMQGDVMQAQDALQQLNGMLSEAAKVSAPIVNPIQ